MSLSTFTPEAPPLQEPFEDVDLASGKGNGYFSRQWINWFDTVWSALARGSAVIKRLTKTEQTAAIAATALALGTLAAGLYRVSWYLRVTQAASVSSAVTFSVNHTDGGIACTQTAPALTTNNTGQPQSGSFMVKIDASAPVLYAVAYASVGTPMQYALDLVVEAVSAG